LRTKRYGPATTSLRGGSNGAAVPLPTNANVTRHHTTSANPIYIGAIVAMLGAAMVLWSGWLVLYALVVLIATHLLVVLYEEPHLRRVFGQSYEDYLRTVHRWIPAWRS